MIGVRFKTLRSTMFFDSKPVVASTDKATRRNLSKFGAFTRKTSKRSIRKRKRISQPGKPPSSHESTLKRLIFFGYDPSKRSVVIGPLQKRSGRSGANVPRTLEEGGRIPFLTFQNARISKRSGRVRVDVVRKQNLFIKARPYMGPAFKKEQSKTSSIWRNSITA